MNKFVYLLVFMLAHKGLCANVEQVRIKDVVNIKGIRSNKLLGYGVVFGLSGTGDSQASVATRKSVAQMLGRLGVEVDANELVTGSFASVLVTADLPPFARSGDHLDLRLSTNGDAVSLAGGTLLMTQLQAGNRKTYVVGQGAVVVGSASGAGKEVLTVARVPGGGQVEREFIPEIALDGSVTLSLKIPDFTSSSRVSHKINSHFRGFYARSLDPGSVKVEIPPHFEDSIVEFIAEMESLKVTIDQKAVLVLNERTGTVVIGNDVAISPVTISHGDLSVRVEGSGSASHKTLVKIPSATVGSLINSLNDLGVKPRDLVAILQAIHAAGALKAELVFI